MRPASRHELEWMAGIGNLYRNERHATRLSVNAVADIADTQWVTVRRLEDGESVNLRTLYRVASVYRLRPVISLIPLETRYTPREVPTGLALCDRCNRPLLNHRIGECRESRIL